MTSPSASAAPPPPPSGSDPAATAAAAAAAEPAPLPVIRALSVSVINRIAAGEVIHRPAHALKELLENALDASCTRVSLVLKEGGLRLLQVTDNGCGIRLSDMPILCRRFTTSKLSDFSQLQQLGTFGFRGEALASISHIARVHVTTRTRDSTCAYRASYSDGELSAPRPGESSAPRPCAGVVGTAVVVEDLFFNSPIRRAALRSASEEQALCVDVVTKYAVHYHHVSFTCKKAQAAASDLHTAASTSPLDTIRALYGPQVAKELLPFQAASSIHAQLSVRGFLSNLNFSLKRLTFLLFVNGRLVDSPQLRQQVQQVYSRHLPKAGHGWMYLSVQAAKEEVDVNVHPTKREVTILHEEELLALLDQAMEDSLSSSQHSRTFYHTPLIEHTTAAAAAEEGKREGREVQEEEGQVQQEEEGASGVVQGVLDEAAVDEVVSLTQIGRERRQYRPNRLVRTDARQGKLASFLLHPSTSSPSPSPSAASSTLSRKRPRSASSELSSVHRLLESARRSEGAGLAELFSRHTFVGVVNPTFSLVQHQTRLYLVDHCRLSEQLLYQLTLSSISSHPTLSLSSPVDCAELLTLLPHSSASSHDLSAPLRFAPMLRDYFSLCLTADGRLTGMPELLPDYDPSLLALPLFLQALCHEVDWGEEERCLHDVCRALARLYRIQPQLECDEREQAEEVGERSDGSQSVEVQQQEAAVKGERRREQEGGLSRRLRWCVEHSLFPACRQRFAPPACFLTDGTVTQVASLETLYKTFERC